LRDIASLSLDLPEADCLLVVPPLAHLTWPSLGVHQLQANAREAGFEVAVLYMNVLYGALISPLEYAQLANAPTDWLLGDRLFARAAFEAPPLGFAIERFRERVEAHNLNALRAAETYLDHLSDVAGEPFEEGDTRYSMEELSRYEALALALVDALADAIAERGYPAVGASTTFDQTAASVALLSRVKVLRPATRTLLGGANCEGEMAEGIRSLADAVDHVFSGESEQTFVRFLRDLGEGQPPTQPILRGTPCRDMDALPTPRFREFFDQVHRVLPELGDTPLWLSYETSRGCWWGQKNHCTFCGLNGVGMGFREKSADQVVAQLTEILAESPSRRICMTDNIMPWRYHETLIPRFPEEVGDVHIFYEQKANLTFAQVKGLWDAGSRTIQPGIEALDSDLLRLMRKGVLARQNIALLRYARSLGMAIKWNLLWGFPGDDVESYRRTLDLLPKLRHLCPPNALTHLAMDRFSPYFDDPKAFGITELAPLDCYAEVFPTGTDLERLAYHFKATYPSGSDAAQPLMAELNRDVWRWREAWVGDPHKRPALGVTRAGPGRYVLLDTRGLDQPPTLYLNEAQAQAVLLGGPLERVSAAEWAIRNGYAADRDGWCVPLAVAPYPLLAEFEQRRSERGEPTLTVVTLT
jgi:ribosomal peptide maturation radical SAM protein 1